METLRSSQPPINFLHLPSLFFLIGYPVFWLELYVFPRRDGVTTPLAWAAFCVFLFIVGRQSAGRLRRAAGDLRKTFVALDRLMQGMVVLVGICAVAMLACALYASFLPPHLMQESDALNYHYTLPRQHLIRGDFQHIVWSSADLFLMPLQTALAPFWFATPLPNKIPQFFFLLGVVLIPMKWVRRSGRPLLSAGLTGLAVMGSHAIGVQMGTAMLDLAICYLFLAAVDSMMEGRWDLAVLEAVFCFWAKPLLPVQWGVVLALTIILAWGARGLGFSVGIFPARLNIPRPQRVFRLWATFLLLSLVIAGPFMVRSVHRAGTPLFPVGAGDWPGMEVPKNSEYYQSISNSARAHLNIRNAYGSGRSAMEFIKHVWLVAVPEDGVTNRFDYPLGLPFLLLAGPFGVYLFRSLQKKVFPAAGVFVGLCWMSWWFSTQQSRFLYVPLILIFVIVLMSIPPSRVLAGCLLIALGMNALSVIRAHRPDWGKPPEEVLRPQDREILEQNRLYLGSGRTEAVVLPGHHAAFARFPVMVAHEKSPFVLSLPETP